VETHLDRLPGPLDGAVEPQERVAGLPSELVRQA
jgi:hypothetical protein